MTLSQGYRLFNAKRKRKMTDWKEVEGSSIGIPKILLIHTFADLLLSPQPFYFPVTFIQTSVTTNSN
jgi:hypothetical protein